MRQADRPQHCCRWPLACDRGDLLVIGAGHHGVITRITSGDVSRYWLAHAHCPVLAVPPSDLAHHTGHALRKWAFRHRALTPEAILRGGG